MVQRTKSRATGRSGRVMSIPQRVADLTMAFLKVTSIPSPADYADIRTAALGVRRAAQALAAEARRLEVRNCDHKPSPNGIYCERCGVRLRARRQFSN